MLQALLKSRAEKKLPEAIVAGDTAKIKHYLDRGARKIDYLLWRDGDFPGDRVPMCKFSDPVKLATYIGSNAAVMKTLADAGLQVPEPQRAPTYGR